MISFSYEYVNIDGKDSYSDMYPEGYTILRINSHDEPDSILCCIKIHLSSKANLDKVDLYKDLILQDLRGLNVAIEEDLLIDFMYDIMHCDENNRGVIRYLKDKYNG